MTLYVLETTDPALDLGPLVDLLADALAYAGAARRVTTGADGALTNGGTFAELHAEPLLLDRIRALVAAIAPTGARIRVTTAYLEEPRP